MKQTCAQNIKKDSVLQNKLDNSQDFSSQKLCISAMNQQQYFRENMNDFEVLNSKIPNQINDQSIEMEILSFQENDLSFDGEKQSDYNIYKIKGLGTQIQPSFLKQNSNLSQKSILYKQFNSMYNEQRQKLQNFDSQEYEQKDMEKKQDFPKLKNGKYALNNLIQEDLREDNYFCEYDAHKLKQIRDQHIQLLYSSKQAKNGFDGYIILCCTFNGMLFSSYSSRGNEKWVKDKLDLKI
ncbi:hypothetical protein PPERSA_06445 [Pseudocohnilembus persalinus]|uniref:Uncharacterized protein n=1 Tax=Pseudocohnilembus persalinus TaxID=266149 RepID=A0A0V0QRC6_PSEPJ|nr:hypothetical protein PPERSA_06445 [Pseudocohnilembus persalinus]|eukprot:KRX04811.1 hypothetical protein PPERSA_06445 [Pseudocohnilembus persalinus]